MCIALSRAPYFAFKLRKDMNELEKDVDVAAPSPMRYESSVLFLLSPISNYNSLSRIESWLKEKIITVPGWMDRSDDRFSFSLTQSLLVHLSPPTCKINKVK